MGDEMSVSAQNDEHELPPTDGKAMALGHLARVLEKRLPGLLDDWVESLENEALWSEIRQLRHPREEPALKASRREALVLVRHIRIVTRAHLGAKVARKKGRC